MFGTFIPFRYSTYFFFISLLVFIIDFFWCYIKFMVLYIIYYHIISYSPLENIDCIFFILKQMCILNASIFTILRLCSHKIDVLTSVIQLQTMIYKLKKTHLVIVKVRSLSQVHCSLTFGIVIPRLHTSQRVRYCACTNYRFSKWKNQIKIDIFFFSKHGGARLFCPTSLL